MNTTSKNRFSGNIESNLNLALNLALYTSGLGVIKNSAASNASHNTMRSGFGVIKQNPAGRDQTAPAIA